MKSSNRGQPTQEQPDPKANIEHPHLTPEQEMFARVVGQLLAKKWLEENRPADVGARGFGEDAAR